VLDDASTPVDVTIPASDPDWLGSNPARGSYKWRGDGTLAGLRRVAVKDQSASRGRFEFRFSGRGRWRSARRARA